MTRPAVYRAMAIHGPATVTTIAAKAGVDERYLLEWLSAQAAAGYVNYDPSEETFAITPEQATVLCAEGHPACMQGLMQQVTSQLHHSRKGAGDFPFRRRAELGRPPLVLLLRHRPLFPGRLQRQSAGKLAAGTGGR
ncbi:MAG: hypothetical protein U5K56_20190 [Halioglobus sp.]|nr:hypothetical protein [Halioglobus sp.]